MYTIYTFCEQVVLIEFLIGIKEKKKFHSPSFLKQKTFTIIFFVVHFLKNRSGKQLRGIIPNIDLVKIKGNNSLNQLSKGLMEKNPKTDLVRIKGNNS